MHRKIISVILFGVSLILFLGFSSLQAQTAVDEIIITHVLSDNYPEVSLRLRVIDESGFPVGGLTLDDLIITEDGRPVTQLSPPQPVDGELWGYFMTNAGIRMLQGDRLDQVRGATQSYLETPTWFVPGDRLALASIEGEEVITRLPFTLDSGGLADNISNYNPNPPCQDGVCSAPLEALDNFLDLNPWQETGNGPKFILIFTGLVDDVVTGPPVDELAAKANSLGIPIYTVVMDGSSADNVLVELARATGGGSINYDNDESINSIYRQIANKLRPHYDISYRSTSGNSSTRQIQIAEAANEENATQITYSVEIAEPRVIIESPSDLDVLEEAAESSPQIVSARVTFPDDHQRNLTVATLLVNDNPVQTLENPDPQQIEFEIPWAELQGLEEVKLSVEVVDELGLTSPETSVQPQHVIGPAPETEAVAPTLAPEATDVPEEAAEETGSSMGAFEIIITLLLVVVIIVAIVLVVIILKNKGTPPVQAVRETIMRGVDRMTQRYSSQSEPKAYLIVMEGDASEGKHLELYGTTTVGRDKQDMARSWSSSPAGCPG